MLTLSCWIQRELYILKSNFPPSICVLCKHPFGVSCNGFRSGCATRTKVSGLNSLDYGLQMLCHRNLDVLQQVFSFLQTNKIYSSHPNNFSNRHSDRKQTYLLYMYPIVLQLCVVINEEIEIHVRQIRLTVVRQKRFVNGSPFIQPFDESMSNFCYGFSDIIVR